MNSGNGTPAQLSIATLLVVNGAGTAAANGVYQLNFERIEKGKPVWEKQGSRAYIKWDDYRGWELYHDGPSARCSYWTQGLTGASPADSGWSVRGASAPAPTVSVLTVQPDRQEEQLYYPAQPPPSAPPPQASFPPQLQPGEPAVTAYPVQYAVVQPAIVQPIYPQHGATAVMQQPTQYGATTLRPGYSPANLNDADRPHNFVCLAIFVCMCCFWPVGLCALCYACQVDKRFNQGDIEGAKQASLTARNLSIAAVICAVISAIICAND